MIGNDIVDIVEAKRKSNWERPRFLDKLFTLNEQQLIQDSDNPFLMVWRLWSMKEAAYKLYTQLKPGRFYNPKKFKCEINDREELVSYRGFRCFVKSKITYQYIVSEAQLFKKEMISECVNLVSNNHKTQSEFTKEALLTSISKQFNILKPELKIVKSEFGIPTVFRNSEKLNIRISISHHGNYGAYAII
jgi:phosphopantetheinyl transferase (holo-ACP synthase)